MPTPMKKTDISVPSAETAFNKSKPRLGALAAANLAPVNVDVQIAAAAALGIAEMIAAPAIRKRFKNLGKSGEYDVSCIDDLATVARAAWYVRHMVLLNEGTRSAAQLPVALVEEATALRTRMAKTAEYNLGDNPKEAAEIIFLRSGTGYHDMANDLLAYAAMYARNKKTLADDKKNYRPKDRTRAKVLAAQILMLIGEAASPELREWFDLQARAWTLLLTIYAEVQRGGKFLFAYEDAETRFPSLTTVARASATRGAKEDSAEPPPAGEAPK